MACFKKEAICCRSPSRTAPTPAPGIVENDSATRLLIQGKKKGLLVNRYHCGALVALLLLSPLALAQEEGSLVKGNGPEVYLIEKGARRHIMNEETFRAMGFRWESVRMLPDSQVGRIPLGAPLTLVDVRKAPARSGQMQYLNPLGLIVEELPPMQRTYSSGVRVKAADRFARAQGFVPGQVIRQVGDVPTPNVSAFRRAIEAAVGGGLFRVRIETENPADLQHPAQNVIEAKETVPFRLRTVRKWEDRHVHLLRWGTDLALFLVTEDSNGSARRYRIVTLADGRQQLDARTSGNRYKGDRNGAFMLGDKLIVFLPTCNAETWGCQTSKIEIYGDGKLLRSIDLATLFDGGQPIAGSQTVKVALSKPSLVFLNLSGPEWIGVDIDSGQFVTKILPPDAVPAKQNYVHYSLATEPRFSALFSGADVNKPTLLPVKFGDDIAGRVENRVGGNVYSPVLSVATKDGRLKYEEPSPKTYAYHVNRENQRYVLFTADVDGDGWDELIYLRPGESNDSGYYPSSWVARVWSFAPRHWQNHPTEQSIDVLFDEAALRLNR
jgi:hypothetical protein